PYHSHLCLTPSRHTALYTLSLHDALPILFDYFSAWAEEREVQLHAVGGPVLVRGDRLMIRRALSNLLSNAIRYAPRGRSVTVLLDRKSTRLNSSHVKISYAVFCLKKKKKA